MNAYRCYNGRLVSRRVDYAHVLSFSFSDIGYGLERVSTRRFNGETRKCDLYMFGCMRQHAVGGI